jgi:hypothetical protein
MYVPMEVWLRLATATLTSLSNVVTAWYVVDCKAINELSLSDIVTAGKPFQPSLVFKDKHSCLLWKLLITAVISFMIQALGLNARLDGVGSSGRARGLLQKPPEAKAGKEGRDGSRRLGPEKKFLKFNQP